MSRNSQYKKREITISHRIPFRSRPLFFKSVKDYLLHQAIKGAERLYGTPLAEKVQQRLELEVMEMEKHNITTQIALLYNLRVEAERRGVFVGHGRGSAPGSLLLYALGITGIDPLKYSLLFERFLNPDTPLKLRIDLEVSNGGCLPQRREEHPCTLLYDSDVLRIGLLTCSHLSIIQNRITYIENKLGKEIQLSGIPTNDEATLQLFSDGDKEKPYLFGASRMRQILKELQPDSLNDLMFAITTLYSKGKDIIPTYIARKQCRETITYHHPVMEQYLKETYGMTLYQEQIMQLAQAIANFSPAESDTLRRALYTRQSNQCAMMQRQFLADGQENGYAKRDLEKIWGDWVRVAPFTVNKSHIASNALYGYQMCYLNIHCTSKF